VLEINLLLASDPDDIAAAGSFDQKMHRLTATELSKNLSPKRHRPGTPDRLQVGRPTKVRLTWLAAFPIRPTNG
jgi:hypothetical protein